MSKIKILKNQIEKNSFLTKKSEFSKIFNILKNVSNEDLILSRESHALKLDKEKKIFEKEQKLENLEIELNVSKKNIFLFETFLENYLNNTERKYNNECKRQFETFLEKTGRSKNLEETFDSFEYFTKKNDFYDLFMNSVFENGSFKDRANCLTEHQKLNLIKFVCDSGTFDKIQSLTNLEQKEEILILAFDEFFKKENFNKKIE